MSLRNLQISIALCACLTLFVLAKTQPAVAQNEPNRAPIAGYYEVPAEGATFSAIEPAEHDESMAGVQIEGGREITFAESKYWKSVFQLTNTATKNGFCTVTLIGPDTIITAAHCIPLPQIKNFSIIGKGADGEYKQISLSKCVALLDGEHKVPTSPRIDPVYGILLFDVTLCLLSEKISGVRYDSVDLNSAMPEAVALVGYGCSAYSSQATTGKIRIAESQPVIDFEEADDPIPHLQGLRPGVAVVAGAGRLCAGDSGGPVYKVHCTSGTDIGRLANCTRRALIAINSARAFSPVSNTPYPFSFIAPLAMSEMQRLFDFWISDTGAVVCGVNAPKDVTCRGL